MSVSKQEAIYALWDRGVLKWKLHEIQKKMYDAFIGSPNHSTTILVSRRFGKSFMLCVRAIELCLQNSNTIVKYICPRKKMVKTIIHPIIRTIMEDAPVEFRPDFKSNDSLYLFPNGSQIQLAGTDNGHAESLRGGAATLCIVDEAGFCDDLMYVVNSILAPTTDTTNGKIILASTPSKESTHEFITEFVNPAELEGRLIKYTIYDNPMMTPEKIAEIIKRYPGGASNPEFRREYLCQNAMDEARAVFPEFNQDLQDKIIRTWPRPARYDAYVSMDIGFKDFTVLLFAYYDFLSAKLIICDELVLNGPSLLTPNLAKAIKEKEKLNFTDALTNEQFIPHRVSDNNNLILLHDLHNLHGITFTPTAKDNKEAAVNYARTLTSQESIIIDPKCKTLIAHLKHGAWNKLRTQFARANGFGHFDALDSYVYLTRNVSLNKNPYPNNYGISSSDFYLANPISSIVSPAVEAIMKIFKIGK